MSTRKSLLLLAAGVAWLITVMNMIGFAMSGGQSVVMLGWAIFGLILGTVWFVLAQGADKR